MPWRYFVIGYGSLPDCAAMMNAKADFLRLQALRPLPGY
jgi:hypothetical protein